jgi:hypothetical protein
LKKTVLGVFSRDNPNDYKCLKMSNRTLDKLFEEEVLMVLERRDEDKNKARIYIQARIVDIYKSSKFIPDEVRMKKRNLKIQSEIEGLMKGSGYGIQFPKSKNQNEYITIGKYKAHKTKLIGGSYKCEAITITKFIT